MIVPPLPLDEEVRLRSLRRLGLLDTGAEDRFDRLCRLATFIFEAPIALVSFVDENRQWFKASVGLDVCQTDRDISFCAHSILSSRPFIIPDAQKDLRFYDNPLVTGAPHLRFYAGIPLKTEDGALAGTFCILDHRPRTFDESEIARLQDLAAVAEDEMNAIGRRQSMEVLRRSEEGFSGAFHYAAIGIALVRPDGRWIKVNASLCDLLGYSEEELTRLAYQDITHPDDLENSLERTRNLLAGKIKSFQVEKRYIHKKRHTIWVSLSVSLLRDQDDQPLYFIAQVQDITQAKRARDQLDRIFNLSPDLLIIVGFDGYLKNVNPAVETLLGYSRAKLFSEPFTNFVHPDDRPKVMSAFQSSMGGRQVKARRIRCLRRDGSICWIEISSVPVPGEGLIYAAARDLTERKLAEEETARVQLEHERILSAVEDGVHWVGSDGLIRFENPAANRMLGYTVGELIGKPAHLTLHHSHADGTAYPVHDCKIYRSLRDGEVRRVFDEVFWRKDGSTFAVEYTCTPIFSKGHPAGVVVTFVDVTQRRAVEAGLQSARLAAENASHAKTDFLANMSHEIRTPLNGIIGMTELLEGTSLNAEQRDYLETIQASGENLLTVVNDVLDFSKIEFGKLEIDRHAFNLFDLVDEVVALLNYRASARKLELFVNISGGLPVDYIGDATRVRQVLINLVTNAIKFTEKGSISIAVEPASSVLAGSNERMLQFSVHDSGIGIPPDRVDRLFQVFSQIDTSTTRRYGGSGLGLAICKKLVELMGGTIAVESEFGQGSCFRFNIPLQVTDSGMTNSPSLAGRRILLVSDSAINTRMLTLLASRWDLSWTQCGSSDEALQLLREGASFDAAILDFQDPEFDGMAVAREVRNLRQSSDLPLVLVAVQNNERLAEEVKRAGISSFLIRPVRQNLLRQTLSDLWKPAAEDKANERAGSAEESPTPCKILVVEDNVTNQRVAQKILQRLGYTSDVAGNGVEALRAAEAKRYDLILMDVHMPEMDGLEATRRLRQRGDTVDRPRIVALTADVLKGEREVCLAAGMDDYITKPVKIDVLRCILKDVPRHATNGNGTAN